VVQEIAARERKGQDVYAGEPEEDASLIGPPAGAAAAAAAASAAAADMLARAGRLVQRHAIKAGGAAVAAGGAALSAVGVVARAGAMRYSGFVPPYEARSRVFDQNELRASAAAAGYTISAYGDVAAPPSGLRFAALARGGGPGPGSASFVSSLGRRDAGHADEVASTAAASAGSAAPSSVLASVDLAGFGEHPGAAGPPSALARALGGPRAPGAHHRRSASAGAVLSGGPGPISPSWAHHASWPAPPRPAGSPVSAGAAPHGVARLSLGSAGSGRGSQADSFGASGAEEPSYAENPVLARLEREFERDPRRHRHAAHLSFTAAAAAAAVGGGGGSGGGGRCGVARARAVVGCARSGHPCPPIAGCGRS
jgi:hypothetical protein